MTEKPQTRRRLRGEHSINVHISWELKERLRQLGEKYERTTSDLVRSLIRVGIPMMEGLSQAEEVLLKEYIILFRKMRQLRELKDL